MMKIRCCHIVASLLLCVASVSAQQSWTGFANHSEEQNALFDAFDCFDESNYLGAARQFRQLRLHIDSMTIQNKSGLLDYTMLLKTEGNCWYLVGNKRIIDEVLRQYDKTLGQHGQLLTTAERDSVMLDVYKLQGSWHYENADADTVSYLKAAECYQRCLDYYRQHATWSVARTDTAVLHQELAQLYYKQQRWEAALAEITMVVNQYRKECFEQSFREEGEYYEVLSQYAICLARAGKYQEAIRRIDEAIEGLQPQQGVAYAEAMRKKAKILLLQSGPDMAQALLFYKTYFTQQKHAALETFAEMSSDEREQYWMRLRPFITDCYQVGGADTSFLYDVVLFSKGLLLQLNKRGGGGNHLNCTWQDIQNKLPGDGCAIEFIQYEKDGAQQMAALVLNSKGTPQFVRMTMPEEVLNFRLGGVSTLKDKLQTTDYREKDAIYSENEQDFRRLVWNADLLGSIGSANKVYFAADGYLHQLAIEYMLPEGTHPMCLRRLTSTRKLLESPSTLTVDHNALVIGGVRFDVPLTSTEPGNDDGAYKAMAAQRVKFNYLEYSKIEADTIIAIRQHQGDSLLIGDVPTEHAFRQLCSHYPIIHMSTHGHFGAAQSSTGTDVKPQLTDESLSESVLFLTGGQSSLDRSETFNPQYEDGLLSARELSTYDLSNTMLVVLSACQTALGFTTPDGVYGIQRGFKNAGVGAIVATLWCVHEKSSYLFIIALYDQLSQGKSIGEAFDLARQALSVDEERVAELGFSPRVAKIFNDVNVWGAFNQPCYRDAFILLDGVE